MKKLLMILGSVFLLIVVVVVAGIVVVAVKGGKLDKESKQYADAAVSAIITNWDVKELEQRLSPEYKSVTKDGDLEKLYALYRKLGKLKEYKGSEGSAMISMSPQQGKRITAVYVGTAEFEAGPAEIKISLIKHGDQWQIAGFNVNSMVLLDTK